MPSQDPDVLQERERCQLLLKALIDSMAEPTGLSIVITAEKMFYGLATSPAARLEWERCIAIMDVAAKRPSADRPACWAYNAIASGLPVIEAIETVYVTPAYTGPANASDDMSREETVMSEPPAAPVKSDKPLTVDETDTGVLLDGIPEVNVELDREAAIETGIELINTALRIELGDESPAAKRSPPSVI